MLIAGVDEVGRGPLAGPVVTAAVILDPDKPIAGLTDSKKLTEKRREALVPIIQQHALSWAMARRLNHPCSPRATPRTASIMISIASSLVK